MTEKQGKVSFMKFITPEKAGISSSAVNEYLKILEGCGLSTHSLILAKGNDIFFEHYWAPFNENFLHRQYSVTKSFVSIAIGFCEQDGLIRLDDKICDYFTEYSQTDYSEQTIRDMLMMATIKSDSNWFAAKTDDRVKTYFTKSGIANKGNGMLYEYDSSGSFVLCALVEIVTGKKFVDYLRQKLFDKIGVSEEAYCLECPGGHSWGDSALLCTTRDLFKVARFVLNKGKWNGEQILNENYLTQACSKQIDNNIQGLNKFDKQGYGYQFWMTYDNSFFFNGMGCQLAVCVPDKDLILVINSDNQIDDAWAKSVIMENFFRLIARPMSSGGELCENVTAHQALNDYASTLKLSYAKGEIKSEFENQVNGKSFDLCKNPMGIETFSLEFKDGVGYMHYRNCQGNKTIKFGMGHNVFDKFPQSGYSDKVGSVPTKNHYYDYAASACWIEPQKLFIKVQIIDKYLGSLNIILSFKKNKCVVQMIKAAENFLNEYQGYTQSV